MDSETFLKQLDQAQEAKLQASTKQQNQTIHVQNTQAVIDSIGTAVKSLMAFQVQHQPKVSVTNQKLPTSIKTPDVQKVVDALKALKQPLQDNKPDDSKIVEALQQLNSSISKLPTSFPDLPKPIEEVTVKNQPDYNAKFDQLDKTLSSIDVKPVINIPAEQPEDYSPILDSLTNVIDAINDIKIPQVPKTDLTPLIDATTAVQDSIQALRFPVPNYVLPYKDVDGKATQVQLDSSGKLPVAATFSGTVTTAPTFAQNPTAPTPTPAFGLVDASGIVQVAVTSGGGAITNYALETGGNLAAIKTDTDKIPSQGQALAAASTPVVLPVAQITTLTPPAAITNYAQETGGHLASIDTNTGTQADTAYTSGSGSIISILKGIFTKLAGTLATSRTWVLGSGTDSVTTVPSGTQAVSGTVTANAGTNLNTSALALDTTLTSGSQKTQVTNFPATQPVSGTFFQTTQPVSLATAPTTPVTGTFFQTTQPVSVSIIPQATLPATEVNGQTTGTTAGTAVQLAANSLTVGVIIQALSTNTTSIFVGTSSVTSSNGFELQPGQATSVGVNNTSAVWIVSTTNGDKTCWIGS